MAKTGNFYHQSLVSSVVGGIGTSYDAAKSHSHDLINDSVPPSPSKSPPFLGYIQSIHLRVGNIAGGSAKPEVTIRLCCDPNGDLSVVPDTTATVALGLTDPTSGVVAYQVQIPNLDFLKTGVYYLIPKIDQGTCDITNSCIMWSE